MKSKYIKLLTKTAIGIVLYSSMTHFALAAPITFVVQGNVNYVDTLLESQFAIGDSFNLEYTFESTALDSNIANPNRGEYQNAISSLSVEIEGYTATASSGNIVIFNDLFADSYRLDLVTPMSGASVNGLNLSTQTPLLQLRNPSQTAFSDDSLPLNPLNLSSFADGGGGNFLALEFTDPAFDPFDPPPASFISANITNFEMKTSVVPETSSISLLAIGLVGLGIIGKSRFHRQKLAKQSRLLFGIGSER